MQGLKEAEQVGMQFDTLAEDDQVTGLQRVKVQFGYTGTRVQRGMTVAEVIAKLEAKEADVFEHIEGETFDIRVDGIQAAFGEIADETLDESDIDWDTDEV